MKTIFITCFTGLIARNILATEAFSRLRAAPGVRIVIITPQSRANVLTAEFGGPSVTVEGVAASPLRGIEQVIWILATNLLPSGTRRVQRRAKLARDGNRADYLASALASAFGRIGAVRRLFRAVAAHAISGEEFAYLFTRYKPGLLFATDVYTPWDVKLCYLARARGVATITMVRSWDNVTSKTILLLRPERVIAGTEHIKRELGALGDVPPERISVVGIPHYDRYRDHALRTPRSEFFRKIGLDPAHKLILFTPPSDHYLKHDPVTPVVLSAIAPLAQVLVRFPLVGRSDLGGMALPPNVVIDEPGASPDFTEAHLSRSADHHLADSIFHADLVITWASTMIIDAAVFDKPILLVGFDAGARPYGESIQQYYDYDHQAAILKTGGARLTPSVDELRRWAERYLADPALDAPGRERLRREFAGELDGRAGERLARLLLAAVAS